MSVCDFFLFVLVGWALSMEPSPLSYIHLGPYLKSMAKNPTIKAVLKKKELV